MKKNKLIALFAGLSLAFVGSAALAAPSPDTLLVAGYDSDSMAVVYGVSDVDLESDTTATLDCTLKGVFDYTVGDATDGIADVETLTSVDQDDNVETPDDTTFEPETVVSDPDNDPALSSVDYGADGAEECALTSVTIEPNGADKITHGTIVSTFAKLLQGGNGCMIKLFAQSEFGKADYQDAEGELTVTLDSIETACAKGKDKKVDDDAESGVKVNGKDKAPGLKEKTDKGGKNNAPGQLKKASQGDDNDSND